MIDLYNSNITDILPEHFVLWKESAQVRSLGYAIKKAMMRLITYCRETSVYSVIDTLPDDILDALATDLNTQYYEVDLDIDVKRSLVKGTLAWYMYAGTPAAVKELVAAVFGTGDVVEWYDYGAPPFWFKIVTEALLREDMVEYFTRMIERVKNTRSHIGMIEVFRHTEVVIYAGCGHAEVFYPQAIMDGGYTLDREADLTVYSGAGEHSVYINSAIREGSSTTSKQAAMAAYAGAGERRVYINPAIMEA